MDYDGGDEDGVVVWVDDNEFDEYVDEDGEEASSQGSDNHMMAMDDSSGSDVEPILPLVDLSGNWTSHLQELEDNISYFYLKNEIGLSEEAMWRITFDAPSALEMTADTIRQKVQVLRDTMDLSIHEIREILERGPAILHLSADKNIAPTILFVLRLLDLSRGELKEMLLACPAILGYSKKTLRAKVRFFTDIMGYSVGETRRLFLQEPKLWRASVKSGLIPRMRFLVKDVEISREQLGVIVLKNPRMLLYSVDDNLIPKLVFYCIMTLNMEPKHVEKLLTSFPDFMQYNLDRHIIPITQYFTKDLDFAPIEFRSILLAYPKLLSNSLAKIKYMVGFLRYEMGFSGPQVKRVLYQAPQVLSLRDTNVREKIHYLERSLELDKESIQALITGMPRVLVLNMDQNIGPKIAYLRKAFEHFHGGSQGKEYLRTSILRLPTLLGYSLEGRLRPRMGKILEEPSLDPSRITVGVTLTQSKFDTWLSNQKRKEYGISQKSSEEKVQTATFSPFTKMDNSESDGSIVHWTRPRRPRS